jgi:peptidoglycan/LPS O-acetylase OafA/YrhL
MRWIAERNGADWEWLWCATHSRIDSLMIGVLLAYWYCFHNSTFQSTASRLRYVLPIAGLILLLPMFAWEATEHRWLMVWGFSLFYIGSACLVMWAVTARVQSVPVTAVAWLGSYSYSIYLWHFAVLRWFMIPVLGGYGAGHPYLWVGLYGLLAFAVGIVAYHVVEYPTLKFRDWLVPSRSGSIA